MSKFQPISYYKNKNKKYSFLPFRFTELDKTQFVLTNMAGEYIVIKKSIFKKFFQKTLSQDTTEYNNLRNNHFLIDEETSIATELLPIKIRTRYNTLPEFTGLHMFVISLRCEHSCPYCQVSRQSHDKDKYDMSEETADKAIDLVFQSPSKYLKIEFQGGEPLLNFNLLKYIVINAKNKVPNDKHLSFVIATNLAVITDEIISFCKEHNINISTSLDGPKELHNRNRPRPGKDSYERTISGINKAKNALGPDSVSALMTTTEASLPHVKEIIDEYLIQNLNGVFLRPLSPYGYAIKTKYYDKYKSDTWLNFYKEGLDYIIKLNHNGTNFIEFYTKTILQKMFTFDSTGYVDLMSPAGTGIAAVIYNYDGAIYASDEGRMLAENKDYSFKLGTVNNTYKEIFGSDTLLNMLDESFAKSVPMCTDCAFEDYCGADPVFHHTTQKDIVGHKPTSEFCNRNMSIFKHLITRMENSKEDEKLFRYWATQC